MHLYGFLSSFLPKRFAKLLTCFILAVLIVLIVFCAFEPQLSFRYGRM